VAARRVNGAKLAALREENREGQGEIVVAAALHGMEELDTFGVALGVWDRHKDVLVGGVVQARLRVVGGIPASDVGGVGNVRDEQTIRVGAPNRDDFHMDEVRVREVVHEILDAIELSVAGVALRHVRLESKQKACAIIVVVRRQHPRFVCTT
jgi:hypothetical protein